MKKLFFLVTFAIALFVSEKAQAQLNIHVGYAPEFFATNDVTNGDTTFFFNGIYVGLNWKFNVSNKINLTAGAQFRMNLRDDAEHTLSLNGNYFIHHTSRERQTLIDIPILLNYDIALNCKVTLSPFIGPTLSWGLNGNTTEELLWPYNEKYHYNWYGEEGERNRFNVYGTAGIKVSFYRFTISGGFRYGFLDLNKNNDIITKTYGFFLSFGHDV